MPRRTTRGRRAATRAGAAAQFLERRDDFIAPRPPGNVLAHDSGPGTGTPQRDERDMPGARLAEARGLRRPWIDNWSRPFAEDLPEPVRVTNREIVETAPR